MLFQRKISKLLYPTLKSENCKGKNVKKDSKCYAEMIRICCVCVMLIFIPGIGTYTRGAGTYGDMGTCPNHILEQSLENVPFFNIVPTKFRIDIDGTFLSQVSSNTFRRH